MWYCVSWKQQGSYTHDISTIWLPKQNTNNDNFRTLAKEEGGKSQRALSLKKNIQATDDSRDVEAILSQGWAPQLAIQYKVAIPENIYTQAALNSLRGCICIFMYIYKYIYLYIYIYMQNEYQKWNHQFEREWVKSNGRHWGRHSWWGKMI